MNPFEATLKNIENFCVQQKIPYSIIGGLALISYQVQRTTNDIDVTLLLELESLDAVGKKIIENFKPVFENPLQFFTKNFVLPVVDIKNNIRIDFAAGLTGFDKIVIERSKRKKFGNLNLPFCSVEDLVLYKLFAGRPRDVSDLYDLSKIYKNKLDNKYLAVMFNSFAKLDREDMKENFNKIFG
jgi:hypothetical protein